MRIFLARALYIQPTLLLLDEPTDHLDLRAVLWLEEHSCQWKKTLLVVSRDRDFLNTVSNEIIHLHEKKLRQFPGNFDNFERSYEPQCKEQKKELDKQKKAAKKSGSQKARVVFTSISMSKPHILLLDEPTNHLDMQSKDALADALNEFTGGVVLVSDDAPTFPGTLEDYKEELLKEIKAGVDD
ncbi:hypothetical protein Cgig2_033155 [Carnegiea gigantea]|uniref:ABC transporter domain-containing protein n=1 Tax=Carnegiea gigantea TaxID=171969 RepID=A0A9Q1JHT4_9CARY|nr:hypothetical protein Cgig2_033155 [Carnegiea gigantea]